LSDIEVKAEVYKVIKAKQDLAVKDILKAVKEHLPDESEDRIRIAIGELL
jgi:3-methyladenine DNA glycosylase AlkD